MDIGQVVGADGGISVQVLTVYVPNKDKAGQEIGNQRHWVLTAAKLLARIGGGVTIMPPDEGGWLAPDGMVIWENPVRVYTFIRPDAFQAALPELRTFLHSLGRETNQGEVAFEFDGRFYRVTTFDAEGETAWRRRKGSTGESKTHRRPLQR